MTELKDILKTKNFIISGIIIKNIKKLNISLNEFLLLVYFINIDNKLDILSIKKYLDLSEEEIINIYSELIKKGLIEMLINKDNSIIEESVSLEPFYNKVLLNTEKEKVPSDIYSKFENEFGRTLSPIEYEIINNWINNNINEEMIIKALKEAVLNGVSNLKYIDKILCEWTKKEIKNKPNERKEELFDYDWLNEDE